MIDNCLGVTVIGLGTTGVGLLSTIVAAPAVIGMEAVSIVMGLLQVVGNGATKMLSLNIEKHEKIAMLAVSALNTISCLISKVLSDNSEMFCGHLCLFTLKQLSWGNLLQAVINYLI